MSAPSQCLYNPAFQTKMALAGANLAVVIFQRRRRGAPRPPTIYPQCARGSSPPDRLPVGLA